MTLFWRGYIALLVCLLFLGEDVLQAQSSAYVRNEGQFTEQVVAHYAFQHNALWFKEDRVRMVMMNAEEAANAVHAAHGEGELNGEISGHVYDMVFSHLGEVQVSFMSEMPDYLNYYLGSDRKKWKSGVKQYEKLSYREIAEDIDLIWELKNGMPKYTYSVGHRGRPEYISLRYEGTRGVSLTEQGYLKVQLKDFFVLEQKPYAFQLINGEEKEVFCQFKVNGNQIGFIVGDYDANYMLYIDPVIIASTYSGSTAEAFGHSATFDGPGNIYSAGRVFGVGYPTDTGSFDLTYNGPFNPANTNAYFQAYDVCISKYNPDGSQRLFSTYLGGGSQELPHSLITNANGDLHVLGSTNSLDFPTTISAFDTTHNGGQDIYVAKFSADGTQLLGATFLGGSGADGVNNGIVENFADEFRGEIMVDDSNQVFIASFTVSNDFPTTVGAFQDSIAGNQDGIVTKLSPNLNMLLFSTYIGGSSNDGAFALKVSNAGRVYVAGSTRAQGFPVDPNGSGAFPVYQGGQADAFILALNSVGSQVLYSSYYGTLAREHSFFLEVDNDDNAYIFGWSNGGITSTVGKYEGPSLGSYIAKFSPELDTLLWQVGFGQYSPSAFLVDQCTQIYVSGQTAVNLFTGGPNNVMNLTTFDTLSAVNNQSSGGFHLMTLSPEGDSIASAFFYGPDSLHVDGGTSRFDKRGYVYQNVCDCSGQFPTTAWAYGQNMQVTVPPSFNSNVCDNCVFKIDFEVPIVAAYATVNPSIGCEPLITQFDNTGSLGSTHFWDFGDGSTSTLPSPQHTYDSAATYQVTYVVSDTFGCNAADTVNLQVTVVEDLPIEILVDSVSCADSVRIYASDSTLTNYTWSNGSNSFEIIVQDTGSYWLIVDRPFCGLDTDTAQIIWNAPFTLTLPPDTAVCVLDFELDAPASFDAYQWNTGDTTSSVMVSSTGMYVLTVAQGACTAVDSTQVLVSYLNFTNSDTLVCDSTLTLRVQEAGGQVIWSTGDTTDSIIVKGNGSYWATVSNGICQRSDTINVRFDPILLPDLRDTIACEPFELDLNLLEIDAYLWSTGDTSANTVITQSGSYWILVDQGLCTDQDTFNVRIDSLGFNQTDIVVCDTMAALLPIAGPSDASYLWSTGDSVATPVVSQTGVYTVTVSNASCLVVDTLVVSFGRSPLLELGEDVWSCMGKETELSIGGAMGTVRWSTGDTTSAITVMQPGSYHVTVSSEDGCVAQDTIEVIDVPFDLDSLFIVPNVMTPNGDGVNDVLGLRLVDPSLVTRYQLTVYNRWGVLQFDSSFLNHDWDGRVGGGKPVEAGTYFYIFSVETQCTDIPIIELKDNVTVLY